MEADLKRKSDLLSEVKVLLKSAAERERRQLGEGDELKRKLRLVRTRTFAISTKLFLAANSNCRFLPPRSSR